ncbi:zinc-ribbon domain-containing protein [Terrisporobacter sp.]|uniref:zinc-ribbon domain-containing protein n=1 Tax=Terrisporobacter sp. TaxID=1965305 RepID=UPI0026213220|nr:zinc-ribbon domain-containing protein [Terrisporobacter sp.]
MYYNENHSKKVEERGYIYIYTYERYEYTLDKHILNLKCKYVRIKCPYCNIEYDIDLYLFNKGSNCTHCCNKYENSFAYHIQVELGEPLNKYWDWEKNTVNPYLIYKNSGKKIWIKCTMVKYHNVYKTNPNRFVVNKKICPYCSKHKVHPKDSFAQYHIDNTDPNFLEKYWSDKNTLNPWKISPKSSKKIWIICQNKDYHDDYKTACVNFTRGDRCPQCSHKGKSLHPKDSFGALCPEKAKYWSSKNKKSPYEVAPNSTKKYKFICGKCGESYDNSPQNAFNTKLLCKECSMSKGEKEIMLFLNANNIKHCCDKPYFKDLLSPKFNKLRPDFILPDLKIWIEYDGGQHFKYPNGIHDNYDEFEYLKKCDEIKDKYAKEHGWKLIRIPYWEFDNINKILNGELIK